MIHPSVFGLKHDIDCIFNINAQSGCPLQVVDSVNTLKHLAEVGILPVAYAVFRFLEACRRFPMQDDYDGIKLFLSKNSDMSIVHDATRLLCRAFPADATAFEKYLACINLKAQVQCDAKLQVELSYFTEIFHAVGRDDYDLLKDTLQLDYEATDTVIKFIIENNCLPQVIFLLRKHKIDKNTSDKLAQIQTEINKLRKMTTASAYIFTAYIVLFNNKFAIKKDKLQQEIEATSNLMHDKMLINVRNAGFINLLYKKITNTNRTPADPQKREVTEPISPTNIINLKSFNLTTCHELL